MLSTIDTFDLTAVQESYLQAQLGNVSRSFALVIPYLENPLRNYLATAYLLCRVVDNIEDSAHSFPWQAKRFNEFSQLLHDPRAATEILNLWQRETWPGLTPAEAALMGVAVGGPLWEIYAQMPDAARTVVCEWIDAMAQGMRRVCDPTAHPLFVERQGVQVLETEADYNTYCYYVAGTVGHLATELVINQYRLTGDDAALLRAGSEACGRALQKTNIVKDFQEDVQRGVSYLPDAWLKEAQYTPLRLQGAPPDWTAMVLGNVMDELTAATDYLLALPYSAVGYRRASLLCFLPAYQTILLAARQSTRLFTSSHQIKISRLTMAGCLADSQAMLFDNALIQNYRLRLIREITARVPLLQPTRA